LQADKGQLPQLKRVLVSDGERVVMEESLSEALEVLFGKSKRKIITNVTSSGEPLVNQADILYATMQE